MMQLGVVGGPGIEEIVLTCVCGTEIPDREGHLGRGFTNFKRLLGYPDDFARLPHSPATPWRPSRITGPEPAELWDTSAPPRSARSSGTPSAGRPSTQLGHIR